MNNNLKIITKGLLKAKPGTHAEMMSVKRRLSNSLKMPTPLNSDLLKTYRGLLRQNKIRRDERLEKFLRKREVRTLSGVAVITVLTKPYACPGQCVYCPAEKGMPKSYLSNEPAAARAKGTKFDPYAQVKVRLEALAMNGHETDKVELIVLGGTWSCYPKKYQAWFVKRCFDALNGQTAPDLARAQKRNEGAAHRCVGLTLETRPDYIYNEEIARLRQLGATRIELGVQSVFDPILKLNQRGQTVKQIINATALLKTAGFKVTYHLMPNLPGSNLKKDLLMFKQLFLGPNFQPDMLKIYPCIVTKNSILYRWYRQGKHRPYSDNQLKDLLIKIKLSLPYYVRLARLIRDIPAESIVAGNKITNLRQIIAAEMAKAGLRCKCLRCREAGHQTLNPKSKITNSKQIQNSKFKIQKYRASEGTEYFLSLESQDRRILYAFLRLRINDHSEENFISELKGAAIIRELHTYGEMIPLSGTGRVQHLGLGKKLLKEAEKIVRQKRIKKIAVISGIGVREYYQKLGYRQAGTYMIKNFKIG
jgi:elongator complex protein 3